MNKYTGIGDTFEIAFDAAADAAFKARTKPQNPDEMFRVRVVSMSAIYGGIVGFTDKREVVLEHALPRSQRKSLVHGTRR